MNSVTNAPTALTWSCDIPALEITTSEDSLALSVLVGSSTIQELTLYSYNGKIILWELRDLVETYMRDNEVSTGSVSIVCDSMTLCSFNVVYLVGVMLGSCTTFCANYFLSLAQAKQLVPGITETLYYYGSEDSATIRVACRDEGVTRVVSQSVSVSGSVSVNKESLETLFDVTDIVGVTVIVGSRMMYYYINEDLSPDYVFRFVNYFGVREVVPINCATSTNQEGKRTIASVGRNALLASLNHEVEHEVETAPLSPLQCSLVEQLCESPKVWLLPSETSIVITERTCDLSDERGEMRSVKFTWRTLPGRRLVSLEPRESTRIFTDEYDETYG